MKRDYREFTEVTKYHLRVEVEAAALSRDTEIPTPWWSNPNIAPPSVGAKIEGSRLGLGPGVVTGYFVEFGWLGLLVKLEDPPEWWKQQNPSSPTVHIFGAELLERP